MHKDCLSSELDKLMRRHGRNEMMSAVSSDVLGDLWSSPSSPGKHGRGRQKGRKFIVLLRNEELVTTPTVVKA